MKYEKGQIVKYKALLGKIIFFYPNYKKNRNAYTVEFLKTGLHRLCFEDELTLPYQVSIYEMLEEEEHL